MVLRAVQACGFALQHAAEHLKANAAIVAAAVQSNGSALQHASEHLKADPVIVAAALRTKGGGALKYAAEGLRSNHDMRSISLGFCPLSGRDYAAELSKPPYEGNIRYA